MDAVFMNSENSKTFEPYRLLVDLADKINIKRSDKYVALSNTKTINLKYQLQHGMKNLIILMDCILYQTFKIIILNIS